MSAECSLHIELLTMKGCPHVALALKRVRKAAALEGRSAKVHITEIGSREEALALKFLGSPSVRINRRDIEPGADSRTGYGLMCRMYGDRADSGTAPTIEMIRKAMQQHYRSAVRVARS